jgi:hypothetical protein
VAFLVILFSGFFMFASAWGARKGQGGGAKPPEGGEQNYTKVAKGAMVYILGKNGASRVMFYTGEPNLKDFERKLHGVLGNGADTVIRRIAEEMKDQNR